MFLQESNTHTTRQMKRRRESEVSSELRSALQELTLMAENLKAGDAASATATGDQLVLTAKVPLKPFLSLCKVLIQVLG